MRNFQAYINPHGEGCFWYHWADLFGPADIKYCEQTLCSIISEPANTWSNLWMMLAGCILIWQYRLERKNDEISPLLGRFGPSGIFMGACSFIYHMSVLWPTQILDYVGMAAFFGLAASISSARWGRDGSFLATSWVWYGGVPLVVLIFGAFGIAVQVVIGAVLLYVFVLEGLLLLQGKTSVIAMRWLVMTFIFCLVAGYFFYLDVSRTWCTPTNHLFFQGHALWHFFGACGMLCVYQFYRQVLNGT